MGYLYKYAIYNDIMLRQVQGAGNIKISPLDSVLDCFGPDVEVVDLGENSGVGTGVGFGMRVLKNGDLLPHSLILFRMDEAAAGATPAPGLSNNALQDAIAIGLGSWGGREITEGDALLLATFLFPEGSSVTPEGTYKWSNPYLSSHKLVRDVTFTPAS